MDFKFTGIITFNCRQVIYQKRNKGVVDGRAANSKR